VLLQQLFSKTQVIGPIIDTDYDGANIHGYSFNNPFHFKNLVKHIKGCSDNYSKIIRDNPEFFRNAQGLMALGRYLRNFYI
jgi:hypothetical protein